MECRTLNLKLKVVSLLRYNPRKPRILKSIQGMPQESTPLCKFKILRRKCLSHVLYLNNPNQQLFRARWLDLKALMFQRKSERVKSAISWKLDKIFSSSDYSKKAALLFILTQKSKWTCFTTGKETNILRSWRKQWKLRKRRGPGRYWTPSLAL